MKIFKLITIFCIGAVFFASSVFGQANPSIAVAPSNSGQVALGATNDLTIAVGNTGAGTIAVSKLRPIVTIPASVTFLADAFQTGLPAGWSILSNTGSQLRLCNSGFVVPGASSTNIILKVQGVTITAPQTFSGQINFGNGTTCAAGTSVTGNNTADDFATSTIEVIAAAACAIAVSATAGTIACNGGTTTLTSIATGTSNPVEYSLNSGAFQAGNTFTVNAAGSPYTVIAREVSTTTCTATATAVTVSQPTLVVPAGSVTTPIATIGGTGVITISATGGTAPYTGTGAFNRTAGTYSFTVTDANSCTATTSVTIGDPAACIITGVTASAGTILCNGGTTTLIATASPAGTYQYSINAGAFQNSNTFTVSSGSYTIVARESANPVCTATATVVTVTNPSNVLAVAAVSTPIAVPGGTGTITVTGTGGTGAKTYVITTGTTINTTGATTGVFTGLSAGSYSFTATDASLCVSAASSSIVLANPGIAEADPAVGSAFFTTTSGGVQSANTLLLAPSTALYDVNVPFFNLNQVNQVPNGTINFTINLGKKLVLAPGFVLASAPLSAYFTWTSANVGGNVIITGTQSATIPADFNAIATFRVKGDSACSSNVVSNIVITNVLQSLADDDLGNNSSTLRYTLPITVSNTQVNVTCNGLANGRINLTVSSGTVVTTSGPGGYTNTQNVASGVNTFSITTLAPGTYTITSTAPSDAPLTSCRIVNTVIISQPSVLTIPTASISSTNNNCFNATDGTITVAASGGTQPYTYTIAGPTVNTTGALNGIFTSLSAGSYLVTVTDNNGCTATTAARVITQPIGGTPDLTLGSDFTDNLFVTVGESETIVYNIAEVSGNSAVGDTLQITKIDGYTITFNPTLFTTTVNATAYNLDNTRWKIDNSNPAFVRIILTDPLNAGNPGTLLCNQLVRVAVSITRNTTNASIFPVSARIRRANGEVNLKNNLNSIIFSGQGL